MKSFKHIIILIISIYAIVVLFFFIFQDRIAFNPTRRFDYITPKQAGTPEFTEVSVTTEDDLTHTYWYHKGQNDKAAILYTHGNTGILADFAAELIPYIKQGYSVLMVEYRGYSKNVGPASETGFTKDAVAGFDFLKDQGHKKIVFHGFSIGTGVAVNTANLRKPDAIILEGAFSSLSEVGQHFYPYLPIKYLMRNPFKSEKHIKNIGDTPSLHLHGKLDPTVPLALAEKLYAANPSKNKKMVIFPDGAHVDLPQHGELKIITNWLQSLGL